MFPQNSEQRPTVHGDAFPSEEIASSPNYPSYSEADLQSIVEVTYRYFLGRSPDPEGLANYLRGLGSGLSVARFVDEVADSQEARDRRATTESRSRLDLHRNADEYELPALVELIFNQFLGRAPSPDDAAMYLAALNDGMSIVRFVSEIANSEEAQILKAIVDPRLDPHSGVAVDENDQRTVVELTFNQFLGRDPSADDVALYSAALREGLPIAQFIDEIANSEEARIRRTAAVPRSGAGVTVGEKELRTIVRLAFNRFLGREPSDDDVATFVAALKGGMSVDDFTGELANCEEARSYKETRAALSGRLEQASILAVDDEDLRMIVKLAFNQFLMREPTVADSDGYLGALRSGLPPARFARDVANSEEARQRQMSLESLNGLTDGEFILIVAELLFEGGGANPLEVEAYKIFLQENPWRRPDLLNRLVADHVQRLRTQAEAVNDPHRCWIMGTRNFLTPEAWKEKSAQIECLKRSRQPASVAPIEQRVFSHSGEYAVSAIASLYKGRKYLEAFLENITSQTIFTKSELIIIDADSPEGEAELIQRYQEVYPNIVYKRMNYRIGIYDAWNEGVRLARGRYLTNTNLDDVRRKDSFEIQCNTLDQHNFVDIVYQDFFYSLQGHIDFERIAEFGFKSELPIVTGNNLLCYNSPHNAPMWRAKLHEDVGMFDISFKSAGDYEFWLRCVLNGKTFYKINTPHVAYFQNPEGISTSAETKGVEEARRLKKMYARKLTSPYLSMSRCDFAAALNADPDWNWETPAFVVVTKALRRLAERF